jgi:hypothetical protein
MDTPGTRSPAPSSSRPRESSQSESDRIRGKEANADKRVVSRWEDTLRLLDATQVVCDRSFGISRRGSNGLEAAW